MPSWLYRKCILSQESVTLTRSKFLYVHPSTHIVSFVLVLRHNNKQTNKSDVTFDTPLFNVLEQCAKLVVEEVHS